MKFKNDELKKLEQKALEVLEKSEDKTAGLIEVVQMVQEASHEELISQIVAEANEDKANEQLNQKLGLKALSKDETEFYSHFKDIRQAVSADQIDIIPTSIVDRTLEDVKQKSSLLDLVEFAPADVKKWLVAEKTGEAIWGDLFGDVTGELNTKFKSLNIELAKLTVFLVIPKAIQDLALPYVDKYFTAILGEALNDGLEKGFLIGTGKDEPIGIYKMTDKVEADQTHKDKAVAADLKNFSPKGLAKAKVELSNKGTRALDTLYLVCNPKDRYSYVDPAIQNAEGRSIASMPITVIDTPNNPEGKAILVIAKKYTMGFSGLKVDTYKETMAIKDADVVIGKVYANGIAASDSIAYPFDVTKLEEYVPAVKVVGGATETPEGK